MTGEAIWWRKKSTEISGIGPNWGKDAAYVNHIRIEIDYYYYLPLLYHFVFINHTIYLWSKSRMSSMIITLATAWYTCKSQCVHATLGQMHAEHATSILRRCTPKLFHVACIHLAYEQNTPLPGYAWTQHRHTATPTSWLSCCAQPLCCTLEIKNCGRWITTCILVCR